MRRWTAAGGEPEAALAEIIGLVGDADFSQAGLQHLHRVVPSCAWAAYRKPPAGRPRLHVSASLGVRDITLDCWKIYVAGAHLSDDTLDAPAAGQPVVIHTTAEQGRPSWSGRGTSVNGPPELWTSVETP